MPPASALAAAPFAAGATLVVTGSVIAAVLAVPRMRLGQAALLFYIATFLLSVRLFSTYWVRTPGWKACRGQRGLGMSDLGFRIRRMQQAAVDAEQGPAVAPAGARAWHARGPAPALHPRPALQPAGIRQPDTASGCEALAVRRCALSLMQVNTPLPAPLPCPFRQTPWLTTSSWTSRSRRPWPFPWCGW